MSSQVLSTQASALTAWVRILRGGASLRRSVSARLQSEHGLSINDYEALLVLSRADEGRMRRVDLASSLVLTASGVTRMLDGLEAAGLVEKASCSTDARVTYAVLTGEGREALECAAADHTAAVAELFEERYSPEELEQLAALLARLPEAGADGSSCTPPSGTQA
jgi:DNA-binding MarR family transcriptional regulator